MTSREGFDIWGVLLSEPVYVYPWKRRGSTYVGVSGA